MDLVCLKDFLTYCKPVCVDLQHGHDLWKYSQPNSWCNKELLHGYELRFDGLGLNIFYSWRKRWWTWVEDWLKCTQVSAMTNVCFSFFLFFLFLYFFYKTSTSVHQILSSRHYHGSHAWTNVLLLLLLLHLLIWQIYMDVFQSSTEVKCCIIVCVLSLFH